MMRFTRADGAVLFLLILMVCNKDIYIRFAFILSYLLLGSFSLLTVLLWFPNLVSFLFCFACKTEEKSDSILKSQPNIFTLVYITHKLHLGSKLSFKSFQHALFKASINKEEGIKNFPENWDSKAPSVGTLFVYILRD